MKNLVVVFLFESVFCTFVVVDVVVMDFLFESFFYVIVVVVTVVF